MKTQGNLAGLCFTLSKTFLKQSLIFFSSFVFLVLVFLIEDVNNFLHWLRNMHFQPSLFKKEVSCCLS